MVKHTQAIRRQKPRNCLSVFDHFMGWRLKSLSEIYVGLVGKYYALSIDTIISSHLAYKGEVGTKLVINILE